MSVFPKGQKVNIGIKKGVIGLNLIASFEDNLKQYNKEFLYNPIAECKRRALILAMGLYLALDGKWTQRNWNVVGFGASGAGKTRFFIIPNILQFDGCYIVVDPSGELEQKLGGGLEVNGYIIKRFSTDDMTKLNWFNSLFYIRKTSDILIVVNMLFENTQEGSGKTTGEGDFWRKASQALLCAIIGYLVEVLPIEQRNFSNVLEILRMNNLDEHADAAEETDFDRLFQTLGDANPASYAYHQYLTFEKAPAKTALNIPLADRTYSWITAMLFSIIFILLYHKGKVRMETEGLTDPELKVPVKCLIDECRNIGKIPNLGEYLATCRKYLISIVPIFQNYSQIVEVYGKEGANAIIGNCDTTIFLGGSDSDTLKIIVERLGKESVKTLSFGSSRGKSGSVSVNKQEVGRELMSRIQVEQMNNTECLVFIRALRPFKVKKYRLEEHPNYKYTAEADKRYLRANSYLLEYNDEEIEAAANKAVESTEVLREFELEEMRIVDGFEPGYEFG